MTGRSLTVGARFRLAIILLCGALVILLWLAQANPYLNPADDSGRYMVLGESLARTGDLRLINDIRQVRDTLYVPGLPAVIAFWLRVTGRDPGEVVLPVKATLLLCLLITLPLFYILLERARLSRGTVAAAMIVYATCPALIAYANEVMSEMPLLCLCLASVVLAGTPGRYLESPAGAESGPGSGHGDRAPLSLDCELAPAAIVGSLVCAAVAYYVRAAGAVLLLSLIIWFWRRCGWRWGAVALAVALVVVVPWQMRATRIIAQDGPGIPHDTYARQFSLKDPDVPDAGRIQMNALGIASRIKRCFPANIGNIPRAVLFSMNANDRTWLTIFYVIAVPFTLLALYGLRLAWSAGFYLVCGFCALFWLFVALWPWINPRFLVPLIPYILLFVFMAAEDIGDRATVSTPVSVRGLLTFGLALLMLYYCRVYTVIARRERAPNVPGYSLGRTRDEAGFYAAAAWLSQRIDGGVVMARPAYLMHLYSLHPTTQVEPASKPRVQELAYMLPNHVRYIVIDRWTWARTATYLEPYIRAYGSKWGRVWTDPRGSGVEIYRRRAL